MRVVRGNSIGVKRRRLSTRSRLLASGLASMFLAFSVALEGMLSHQGCANKNRTLTAEAGARLQVASRSVDVQVTKRRKQQPHINRGSGG